MVHKDKWNNIEHKKILKMKKKFQSEGTNFYNMEKNLYEAWTINVVSEYMKVDVSLKPMFLLLISEMCIENERINFEKFAYIKWHKIMKLTIILKKNDSSNAIHNIY